MCRKTQCKECGKPTWAGCGKHIDAVLAEVAVADRCTCERTPGGLSVWLKSLFG